MTAGLYFIPGLLDIAETGVQLEYFQPLADVPCVLGRVYPQFLNTCMYTYTCILGHIVKLRSIVTREKNLNE